MAKTINPAKLTNAVKAPIPESVRPALATLSQEPPTDAAEWFYEIKFDGIRTLSFIDAGKTRLFARSGRDISREYPELAALAKQVRARRAILDGEIVVLDPDGRSAFQRLQARFGVQDPSRELQQQAPPTLYLFDLLYCDGYDLRRTPLLERKMLLTEIVCTNDQVRISEHHTGEGRKLYAVAMKQGLEGIIGKRAQSAYPDGRSTEWLKFKGVQEIDGVIGGWTSPRGSRQLFGSLLVGLYEGADLQFVGGVGTGYSREVEKSIYDKLKKLKTPRCPFNPEPRTKEESHWVKPAMVARVGYAEWTSDRHLRQPRFLGLQPDRKPKESTFVKEKAPALVGAATESLSKVAAKAKSERASSRTASTMLAKLGKPIAKARATTTPHPRIGKFSAKKSPPRTTTADVERVLAELRNRANRELSLNLAGKELKLTHLDKIYFPKDGYTKRDVLLHYTAASPHLLPFLADRPLVLHRYPNGIAAGAFYQKDSGPGIPDWIRTVKIYSGSKREEIAYFLADDLASLLYLTNLGCIEQNPFSARADDLEKPDYMFIDLDPTDGTGFQRVVQSALLLGKVLEQAKLEWFTKTSGATGLHIFIPVQRKYSFEQARGILEIVTHIAVEREKNLLTRIHTVRDRPKNTVFVDVRQNAYAQSLASVFSIRPRDGAPVSTPIARNELKPTLRPDQWNIRTIASRLAHRAKLWSTFWKSRQTIERALASLEKLNTT
jgi:bifunctional non-homologous end joining protein LigD